MEFSSDSNKKGSKIRFKADHVSFLIEVFVTGVYVVMDLGAEAIFSARFLLVSVESVVSRFDNG